MTEQTQTSALPEGAISEWKPSRATWWLWTVAMLPIFLVALGAYIFIATHGETHATGSASLPQIVLVVALSVGILCVHEGVHGIVMIAFGARPQFGLLMTKVGPMGLYATAPGNRFGRRQYLLICLAPLGVLAPLGALACWLPVGGYLVLPLAIHAAGCVGDVTIAWHVLRAPSGAACEDMRDGTRFWKPEA